MEAICYRCPLLGSAQLRSAGGQADCNSNHDFQAFYNFREWQRACHAPGSRNRKLFEITAARRNQLVQDGCYETERDKYGTPDEIVSMAIAYLDSATDYREFIGRTEQPRVTRRRRNRRPQSQEESLWLLLVPVAVIIIAVITLMAR
jgi:hypothetical protein